MIRVAALLALFAGPTVAETLVAVRTLPAGHVIAPGDVTLRPNVVEGALSDPEAVLGMEARVALYAGRPIRPGEIGPPAVIERNQLVNLVYLSSGLQISTEGRALDRAGPGDMLRVMNTASRNTVTARAGRDGVAYVFP